LLSLAQPGTEQATLKDSMDVYNNAVAVQEFYEKKAFMYKPMKTASKHQALLQYMLAMIKNLLR
jgi:hypothetical protein